MRRTLDEELVVVGQLDGQQTVVQCAEGERSRRGEIGLSISRIVAMVDDTVLGNILFILSTQLMPVAGRATGGFHHIVGDGLVVGSQHGKVTVARHETGQRGGVGVCGIAGMRLTKQGGIVRIDGHRVDIIPHGSFSLRHEIGSVHLVLTTVQSEQGPE